MHRRARSKELERGPGRPEIHVLEGLRMSAKRLINKIVKKGRVRRGGDDKRRLVRMRQDTEALYDIKNRTP